VVLNAANALVHWLETLDDTTVLLFTFLSSAVEMMFLLGLLIPGESVVMLAASAPAGPAGFALVVVIGTAGALSGQLLGYAVGRAFGPRIRDTRLGRRIGADRFDRAEAYLRTHGGPALAAVRFVAVIHAIVPIVAGSVRMPFGRFVGWSALGTTVWVSAFAGVGVATAGAGSSGGVALVLTAVGATCLGAVPFAARFVRRGALRLRRPAPAVAATSATSRPALHTPSGTGQRRETTAAAAPDPRRGAARRRPSPTGPAAHGRWPRHAQQRGSARRRGSISQARPAPPATRSRRGPLRRR